MEISMVASAVRAVCARPVSEAVPVSGRRTFAQSLDTALRSQGTGAADRSGLPQGPRAVEACEAGEAEGRLSAEVRGAFRSVADAQARLDGVLRMAETGRGLSPAALLGLQADVYRSSQLLELSGKVVERGSAGIRQVLTTQL